MIVKVLLGLAFVWISDATFDLTPREKCVPTAAAHGECHICVCSLHGMYYCRRHYCKEANLTTVTIIEGKRECEPDHVYREDFTFCSCSEDGLWVSHNCREKFRAMKPNTVSPIQKLKTNIKCTPNYLYLLDCNICVCGDSGFIELSSCTTRKCIKGRKTDKCNFGEILRTKNELCSCSDINLYIDRLCLKVADTAIQVINRSDLEPIIDINKTWTRTNDIYATACIANTVTISDCNRCFCTIGGVWGCTMKGCVPPTFVALRSTKQENEFYSFPILGNEKESCEPGKTYRYKCNSCICSRKKVPMCTTMVCLEDVVLDKRIVEKAYLEGHAYDRSY